jgi:hypothetical protein
MNDLDQKVEEIKMKLNRATTHYELNSFWYSLNQNKDFTEIFNNHYKQHSLIKKLYEEKLKYFNKNR